MSLHDFREQNTPIETRVSVGDMLPDRAIKEGRTSGTITEVAELYSYNTVPNGVTAINETITTSLTNGVTVSSVAYAVYINDTYLADILIPYQSGTSVDCDDYTIVGPLKSSVDSSNVDLEGTSERWMLSVKNNSGSQVTMHFFVKIKYIMNRT